MSAERPAVTVAPSGYADGGPIRDSFRQVQGLGYRVLSLHANSGLDEVARFVEASSALVVVNTGYDGSPVRIDDGVDTPGAAAHAIEVATSLKPPRPVYLTTELHPDDRRDFSGVPGFPFQNLAQLPAADIR